MLKNQDFTQDRSKYLGGSDIAPILGLSKYRTSVDVWLEKTGKHVFYKDSLPLRFGKFAEAFVAQEYAQSTGQHLSHQEQAVLHTQYPYLQGHIDRFVMDNQKEPVFNEQGICLAHKILECKTANAYSQHDWGEPGTDQIPMPYLVQCSWYMLLTQVEQCDLAVLIGNADLRIYPIHRDLELEALLLHHTTRFWEEHVLRDIPPQAKTEADYQQLFRKGAAKSVEANPDTVEMIQRLHTVQTEIESYEIEVSQIKQHIMGQMQDAEVLTYTGKTLATWRAPKPSTRLDAKRLADEHPEWVTPYQVPVQSSRRLLIKQVRD